MAKIVSSMLTTIGFKEGAWPRFILQKNYYRDKNEQHIINYKDSDCCVEVRTYNRSFVGITGEHVAVIMPMCSGKSFYSRKFNNVIDVDKITGNKKWNDPEVKKDIAKHSLKNKDTHIVYLIHSEDQRPAHIQ